MMNKLFNHQNKASKITLWGVSVSPFVRKVKVALAEKGLAYEQQSILPTLLLNATNCSVPEKFAKTSPLGKIPAINDGEVNVSDSAVICAYLERAYPTQNKLYPECNEKYARVLWFENFADNVFAEIAYKKIFMQLFIIPHVLQGVEDKEMVETAKSKELPRLFDFLESSLQGKWIIGDDFSVADIALVTHFISLKQVDVLVDETQWPKLHAYIERVLTRSSFSQVLEEK